MFRLTLLSKYYKTSRSSIAEGGFVLPKYNRKIRYCVHAVHVVDSSVGGELYYVHSRGFHRVVHEVGMSTQGARICAFFAKAAPFRSAYLELLILLFQRGFYCPLGAVVLGASFRHSFDVERILKLVLCSEDKRMTVALVVVAQFLPFSHSGRT